MDPEPKSKGWTVAWISASAIIIAAIIGLGRPFADNLAARYFPPPTAIPNNPPTQAGMATASPQSTLPQTAGICQEEGGASGFPIPPTPSAPTNGCVLVVEWWVPPDANNCGILITTNEPVIPEGSTGAWWYVYPQRPDSHKQEFLAKNPHCKVEDFR